MTQCTKRFVRLLHHIALDLGLAGGPLLVGVLAGSLGLTGAFAVCAAVTVLGMAWTWWLSLRTDPAVGSAGIGPG